MAGTYRPGSLNPREDTYQASSSSGSSANMHGRYGQPTLQKNSADRDEDRNRMKEQAQLARVKETQPEDDGVPAPLFGLPIKMNRTKDPVHNMITKVLGNYDEVKNIVSHPSFIGVVHQPNTPVRTKTQGDLFGSLIPATKPDEREKAKERERQQQREKEREKEQHRTSRPGGSSSQQQPQNNGAFPSNSKPKVKDPRDRDNVFDKFLPSDSGPGGSDQPAKKKKVPTATLR